MSKNKENTRSFNEQAYLIYNEFIRSKGKTKGSKIDLSKLKETGKVHKIVGNYTPATFISRLNSPKTSDRRNNLYRDFIDLETYKISNLIPEISFHKVVNGKYVPFYFPVSSDSVTPETILRPGFGINGVGIKNFNINFTGNNPFDFDKQVECSLEIFLDNLETIFKEPPTGYAPLAELFTISRGPANPLKQGLSKGVAIDQVNNAYSHEISARVGYSLPMRTNMFTAEETTAILDSALSLRMTLTDHTISVNQDGTATISISYIGRIDGLSSDSNLNLLGEAEEVVSRVEQITPKSKQKKPDSTEKEKNKKESRVKTIVDTHTRMRKFFTYLEPPMKDFKECNFKNSRIHRIKLSNQDIQIYKDYGSTSGVDKLRAELQKGEQTMLNNNADFYAPQEQNARDYIALEKELQQMDREAGYDPTQDYGYIDPVKLGEETLAQISAKRWDEIGEIMNNTSLNRDAAFTRKNKIIDYVYAGDLVESVFHNTRRTLEKSLKEVGSHKLKTSRIKESLKHLERVNVLFGTVPIQLSDSSTKFVNLADIPLSLKVLQKYFFEEVEQKHRKNLSLTKFLNDLTSKIIPNALNGHSTKDAPFLSANASIRTLNITGPNLSGASRKTVSLDIDSLPDFIRKETAKQEEDESEYYVVYSELPEKATVGLSGDLIQDVQRGIYHFHIGKDRGLLKTIEFTRDDTPFRKEALMVESVNLYDELKMPYQASINMVGNNLFLPGAQIYINPSSIGFGDPRNRRSAAARLGIGGYYTVLTVSTTFDGSSLNTSLSAMYTSWADNDKDFIAELEQARENPVNSTPEGTEGILEASALVPEHDPVVGEGYETIRESFMLTKEEKDEIILSDISGRDTQVESIRSELKESGSRVYTVSRPGPAKKVVVTVNPDNSISIHGGG